MTKSENSGLMDLLNAHAYQAGYPTYRAFLERKLAENERIRVPELEHLIAGDWDDVT